MSGHIRRQLAAVVREAVGTGADGAFDLLRALRSAERVDEFTVRVRCSQDALAFIAREEPEMATLWPAAFGIGHGLPVDATDELTPALTVLFAQAREQAGVVLDASRRQVRVTFPDGSGLVVAGSGMTMRWAEPERAAVGAAR